MRLNLLHQRQLEDLTHALLLSDALVVLYDSRRVRKQFMHLSVYSVDKTTW